MKEVVFKFSVINSGDEYFLDEELDWALLEMIDRIGDKHGVRLTCNQVEEEA